MGSLWPTNKKSEKFEDGKWRDIGEPPVHSLGFYAVIFHAENFYYFGGYDQVVDKSLSSILALNAASWTWSNIGQLNSARHAHGVTSVNNMFIVIGGLGTQPNEACSLRNDEFICREKNSSLYRYAWSPLLFLVNDNYENC